MATAIPQSMTFEMLSRLPANSFVLEWKEVRPDTLPPNNRWKIQGSDVSTQNISFHLRGAPNEFVLNTNCYLSGTSYGVIRPEGTLNDTNRPAFPLDPGDLVGFKGACDRGAIEIGAPYRWFNGSRESFNAGSLPFLDNQNTRRSIVHNFVRALSTARNMNVVSGKLLDFNSGLGDFKPKGETQEYISNSGSQLSDQTSPFRFQYIKTFAAAGGEITTKTISLGKNKNFQIPLGMYSNLINSHSVLPVGLMSSYSVNGYNITVSTNTQTGQFGDILRVNSTEFQWAKSDADGTIRYRNVPYRCVAYYIEDLRINLPIIKVLDPAVMEAVLSLYEKREVANLGGVAFPMSLRLNSLGYRFSAFPLQKGNSDYHFRIAGTDRSVRAIKYIIYDASSGTADNDTAPLGYLTSKTEEYNTGEVDNFEPNALKVVRLETKIGSEVIHPVVEDRTINTDNVDNFVNINTRKSGHLFSTVPYYREDSRMAGYICDDLQEITNQNNLIAIKQKANPISGATSNSINKWWTKYQRRGIVTGTISFENLDRREGDHSGSYQASGKDLTNVGSIEIDMRIGYFKSADVKTLASIITDTAQDSKFYVDPIESFQFAPQPQTSVKNYEIVFMYAYDAVHEVSSQGVMDITNAVL